MLLLIIQGQRGLSKQDSICYLLYITVYWFTILTAAYAYEPILFESCQILKIDTLLSDFWGTMI